MRGRKSGKDSERVSKREGRGGGVVTGRQYQV